MSGSLACGWAGFFGGNAIGVVAGRSVWDAGICSLGGNCVCCFGGDGARTLAGCSVEDSGNGFLVNG